MFVLCARKGTIATPFEFRPYAVELQLCQRYYEVIGAYGFYLAPNGSTALLVNISFKVDKRASVLSVSMIGPLAFSQLGKLDRVWNTATSSINTLFSSSSGCSFQLVSSVNPLATDGTYFLCTLNGIQGANVFAISNEL